MSAWIYRKPEATHTRGFCVLCKKNLQKKRSNGTFQAQCTSCERKRWNMKFNWRKYKDKIKFYGKKSYRKNKKLVCEICNFIAQDKCQIDIHHKDGNHHNNDPNNLQYLCANCHRLIHKDGPARKLTGLSLCLQ